jgi:AcrR family transcriptional regulator
MNVKRTKHAERSEATRAALMAAARPLFAERGYAAVGTEEIVRAAGVTRGALYHQFADKRELFAAVFEQVEAEVTQRTASGSVAPEATAARAVRWVTSASTCSKTAAKSSRLSANW